MSQLVYSTYLAGDDDDFANGVAFSSGDIVVTGQTRSDNYPTSIGAFQTARDTDADAFVTKIDTTMSGANSLAWSTYYGGNDNDEAWAVAVNAAGEALITGATVSTDLPVTPGAISSMNQGGTFWGDIFIAHFNMDASGVQAATYFGDSGDEVAFSLIENNGLMLLAGLTDSTGLGSGSFQNNFQGIQDGFVTLIAPVAADIDLDMVTVESTINAGEELTFTATVTNNGPGHGEQRRLHDAGT